MNEDSADGATSCLYQNAVNSRFTPASITMLGLPSGIRLFATTLENQHKAIVNQDPARLDNQQRQLFRFVPGREQRLGHRFGKLVEGWVGLLARQPLGV